MIKTIHPAQVERWLTTKKKSCTQAFQPKSGYNPTGATLENDGDNGGT